MELMGHGGVTRMGISVYNTSEEIEYVIDSLKSILQ
jgi:selenocysteine lyase/cysteine desulfurase